MSNDVKFFETPCLFKEKPITRHFVRYIKQSSSGKNNTQCITYLKAKNKTNDPMIKCSLHSTQQ